MTSGTSVSFIAYNKLIEHGEFTGVDPASGTGLIRMSDGRAWQVADTEYGLRAFNADAPHNHAQWFPVVSR